MNADSLPLLIGGIISLILSAFLFIKKKDKKTVSFALSCIFLSIHGLSSFFASFVSSMGSALLLNRISIFGTIAAIPFFTRFVVFHTNNNEENIFSRVSYYIAILFSILNIGPYLQEKVVPIQGGVTGIAGPIYPLFGIYLILNLIYVTYRLSSFIKNTKKDMEKNRTKYFLTFLTILGIFGLIDILRKLSVIYIVPILLTEYGIIIFIIGTTYTIIKFHLLDINLIFKKSTKYSLIGIFVLSLFEVIKIVIENGFELLFNIEGNITTSISIILLSFFFEPIKKKTEDFVDKIFIH